MDLLWEAERHLPIAGEPLGPDGFPEPKSRCAYNQTKEHVLSLKVTTGDFPAVSLSERLPALTPRSGAGLWMLPFRGIPATDVSVPLDLIYLDGEGRVIDVVEFFPTFRVSPSSPPAASVLALPAHSIYSSQTQKGDQLLLCAAEELEEQLARVPAAPGIAVAQNELLRSDDARKLELVNGDGDESPEPQREERAQRFAAGRKNGRQSKGWLERWWSPEPADPRSAARSLTPGLAAYFWTGSALEPHAIRNISAAGLYVVTEERWYPGTLVQLTLTKTDREAPGDKRFISLQGQVMRWGNDGVGLQFVVYDPRHSRRGHVSYQEGIDPEELEGFLEPFLEESE